MMQQSLTLVDSRERLSPAGEPTQLHHPPLFLRLSARGRGIRRHRYFRAPAESIHVAPATLHVDRAGRSWPPCPGDVVLRQPDDRGVGRPRPVHQVPTGAEGGATGPGDELDHGLGRSARGAAHRFDARRTRRRRGGLHPGWQSRGGDKRMACAGDVCGGRSPRAPGSRRARPAMGRLERQRIGGGQRPLPERPASLGARRADWLPHAPARPRLRGAS